MTSNATYTSIDLNDTSTTSTIFDPLEGRATGVYLKNGGSTAEFQLESTDGSSTAVLAVPGAGNNLEFGNEVHLDNDDSLQINVTTAEGSSQTNTCVVFYGESV